MQPLDLYATIEQELDFVEEISHLHNSIANLILALNPISHIDIGCGQGDFCKTIQDNGIETLGVDLSSKQIEIAKTKNIDAQVLDIKDCTKKFDCATAIFDVINYIPKEDLKQFFSNIYKLLNPNGYFIFDINTHYGFQEVAQGSLILDKEKRFVAIDANFIENCLYTDMTLFTQEKDGLYQKHQGTIKQFYHTEQELQKILHLIGFEVGNLINFNLHCQDEFDKQIFICKRGK